MELTLQIILRKPPFDIFFALQKGSGNQYEIIQNQEFTSADLRFECTVEIKGDKQKDVFPDFKGQFVQGPKDGRFIYITIRGITGRPNELCNGRMKIPLTGIAWDTIDKASSVSNYTLQTQVAGTGKNGGPNYATVKPFEGWTAIEL
jgi:hypothetical protein